MTIHMNVIWQSHDTTVTCKFCVDTFFTPHQRKVYKSGVPASLYHASATCRTLMNIPRNSKYTQLGTNLIPTPSKASFS